MHSRHKQVPRCARRACGGGGTMQFRVPEVDVLGDRRAPWARIARVWRGHSLVHSWEWDGELGSLGYLEGQEGPGFPANGEAGFCEASLDAGRVAGKPEQARTTRSKALRSPRRVPGRTTVGRVGRTWVYGFCSVLVGARSCRSPARQSVSPAVDWRDLLISHGCRADARLQTDYAWFAVVCSCRSGRARRLGHP